MKVIVFLTKSEFVGSQAEALRTFFVPSCSEEKWLPKSLSRWVH